MNRYVWPGVLLMTAIVSGIWSFAGAQELDVWLLKFVPSALGVLAVVLLAGRFQFSGLIYA